MTDNHHYDVYPSHNLDVTPEKHTKMASNMQGETATTDVSFLGEIRKVFDASCCRYEHPIKIHTAKGTIQVDSQHPVPQGGILLKSCNIHEAKTMYCEAVNKVG